MTNQGFSTFHGATRKRSLFAHVVNELGGRIVRGAFEPGGTLPTEDDLGRELGASRSVVREAVKSLAAKGLLESRTRTGTRVLPPSQWNMLDLDVLGWRYASMPPMQFFREIFEIRHMIEPQASALAAERATPADVAVIAQAYDDMVSAEDSSDMAIDADKRFHRGILAATHNDLVQQMGALIGVGLFVSFRISSQSYAVFLPQHRTVLDAIAAHDPAAARAAMDSLLAQTRAFLERQLVESAKKEQLFARTRAMIDEEMSREG